MPRTVPAVVALVLLLAAPASAAAQLTLTWEAPAECPTADTVRAEVVRLLGGSLPDPIALEANAATSELDGRWTLRLRTTVADSEGERVVEADGCAPLADAAALILALMIDPAAVAENTPPPPAQPTPAATEPAPRVAVAALADPRPEPPVDEQPRELVTPPRPVTSRSEGEVSRVVEHGRDAPAAAASEPTRDPRADTAPGEPLLGFIGLGGALDVGSVPAPSGAIAVEGGFGIPLVDARLRATFVFGNDATRDGRGARITTGMLDARACFHPFDEARFLHGCLGLALGLSVAEGFGVSGPEVGIGTFGAAVAGLGLAWAPEPWFDLELDATLIVAFNPLEFAVRGSPDDVFHAQEPVAGRFGAAIHVRF